MSTELDLEELRKLEAAATAGEWHRHTYGHANLTDIAAAVTYSIGMTDPPSTDASWLHANEDGPAVSFVGNGPKQTDNGDFIVALRNAAPDLIAAAEREAKLRAALSELVRAAFRGDDFLTQNNIPMAATPGVRRALRKARAALGDS
jgi:hypothetical protein